MEPEEEMPLDPAAERLRIRLTRLFLVSIAVMGLGIMTVLGLVVYRTMNEEGGGMPRDGREIPIALPEGTRIVEMVPHGDRLFLRTENGAATVLYIVDLASGNVDARYPVEAVQ